MSRRLPHYLKHERRRAGFSQAEVAYFLGGRGRSKVVRYERGEHLPPLRTALAYEVMLGIPVAQLFPTAFAAVRACVRRRARQHARRLARLPKTPRSARRQRSLHDLLARR